MMTVIYTTVRHGLKHEAVYSINFGKTSRKHSIQSVASEFIPRLAIVGAEAWEVIQAHQKIVGCL